MERAKLVPLFELSFNRVDGYVITEKDVFLAELTKSGHFSKNLLYSAFRADRIPLTRRNGTYRMPGNRDSNIVFCCHVGDDSYGSLSIVTYDREMDLTFYLRDTAKGQKHAAFAVYNREELEELALEKYRFRHPDRRLNALRAVYKIKDYWKL